MNRYINAWVASIPPYLTAENKVIDRYKTAFLDKALGLGGLVAAVMSLVRMQYSLITGVVELGFAATTFLLMCQLRRHPSKVDVISTAAMCLYWVLFLTIFVYSPYNKTRFVLFFLLAAAALFLKGREVGLRWVFGVLFSVIAAHLLMRDSGYSHLDILTGVVHTFVLLIIFDYYEKLVQQQHAELQFANLSLEEDVQQRTLDLQQANEALQNEKEALRNLSYQDQLTGLYNRHKIAEVFDHEKKQTDRYHEQFSLILMDVDRFKAMNDTYGHHVGDEVLKEVARILINHTRKSDLVARWGGDEFVIIATKTDLQHVIELAEAIRERVQKVTIDTAEGCKVTVSIGVATVATDDSLKTMLCRADEALYEAKGAGRNQVKSL